MNDGKDQRAEQQRPRQPHPCPQPAIQEAPVEDFLIYGRNDSSRNEGNEHCEKSDVLLHGLSFAVFPRVSYETGKHDNDDSANQQTH